MKNVMAFVIVLALTGLGIGCGKPVTEPVATPSAPEPAPVAVSTPAPESVPTPAPTPEPAPVSTPAPSAEPPASPPDAAAVAPATSAPDTAATPAVPAQEPPKLTAETVGTELVDALAKDDLETACSRFTKSLRESMPPERLKDRWERVVKQFGAYKERQSVKVQMLSMEQSVLVTCAFEQSSVCFQVTVNNDNEVTGVFVRPAHEPNPVSKP